MTQNKKIKYGVLFVLLLLTLSPNVHFGDYCEGMFKGLLFLFFSFIFTICFLVIEIRDLYKLVKCKKKFDFIPLLFLVIFIFSNWFLMVANENKFWKEIAYEGVIFNKRENLSIVLYKNNLFETTESHVENRCTFTGKYHFEKNILILDDENIQTKTDHYFTNKYILVSDTILEPLDKKYFRIQLKHK